MKFKDYLKQCNKIYHTTLDPNEFGVVRIHLIPPKKCKPEIPWVVILNGYYVLQLQSAWAVLLKIFIEELNYSIINEDLTDDDIKNLINQVTKKAKEIFPKTEEKYFKEDLNDMICVFKDIALQKEIKANIGLMSFSKYYKYMPSVHRMDLMLSSMSKEGIWNCNQHCIHCYAANEKLSGVEELDTDSWKKIIDRLKKGGVTQLTFTGGEATLRSDLVTLVDYSKWFVTRLNTNGVLLTKELCHSLYEASLDSVQITLYSYDENIHNFLVGNNNFNKTIEGIKNALESGLDVSVNTPLCNLNMDYSKTLEFLKELGVKYFSCSGLILTGKAKSDESKVTRLKKDELLNILSEAVTYAKDYNIELSFTSPGWCDEKELKKLGISSPMCGACLSNMAVAPNGDVIPCQSWLSGISFGNLLNTTFKSIYNSKECKKNRVLSAKSKNYCQLKGEN